MTTLKTVYERQQAAREARWRVSETYEDIYWSLDARARDRVNVWEHPQVLEAQAASERLAVEVAALREEVGGRVFRVVDSKLAELRDRIAKLNKKAVKLGTGEITLTVSRETEQVVRKRMKITDAVSAALAEIEGTSGEYIEEVIDFTFITVDGETPQIEGWVFLATLDHEADQGADESVGIRRVPTGTGLINRIGEQAAAAVEAADLTRYRHAGPNCDHCKLDRRRKQTYVLYEVATGELRQIGSTCLKDYTGAHNPERVAAWAEWLEALYSDLGFESGDDGFGDVALGGGRIAIRTLDYLVNVAAMIREIGWTARWAKDYYGEFTRNYGATADRAKDNYLERNPKLRIATTEEDRELASTALDWVREDLGERDEADLDEFQHNLVTYCRADYLGEKGDGFVAAAIGAYQRDLQRKLEAERVAGSEWIATVGDRIKGLTFTVTFVKSFEGQYGTRWLTKGHDADGNQIIWWGAGGIDQGETVTCSATVKKHEIDSYNEGAKVTQVTNLRSIQTVETSDAAVEVEVTKTAAEREQDRLRRINPVELDEQLDSAIASLNDYQRELNEAHDVGWREYYGEHVARLNRLITRLQADQSALREGVST